MLAGLLINQSINLEALDMSGKKVPGVLHLYSKSRVAFEFEPVGKSKVLIFVGGLTDGLLTVPYVQGLAKTLEPLGFSVVQIQFSSSYLGFGTGSLKRDDSEIDQLVDYLRSDGRETILLMGHSTGSQNTLHYLTNHPGKIEGGVLQAAVSDREFICSQFPETSLQKLNEEALALVKAGKGDELVSEEHRKVIFGTPITAYRWCSLVLPGGDDDFFSSDISDDVLKTTFGVVQEPFLVALSEKDEFTPENVDREKLLGRWEAASDPKRWSKNSGLIRGASHNVAQAESQKHLYKMVAAFIQEFSL